MCSADMLGMEELVARALWLGAAQHWALSVLLALESAVHGLLVGRVVPCLLCTHCSSAGAQAGQGAEQLESEVPLVGSAA